MKTPRGTLFSYYEPCVFRDLIVKTTDSYDYENDFVIYSLIGEFESQNSDDFSDICFQMEKGASIPLSLEETNREGLFDDEQLFLVYEKEDIKKLADRLSDLALINK